MYFVNREHEVNFNELLSRYPIGRTDSQYRAGFYVVAHPIVYDCCNMDPASDGHGPFDWYFAENGELSEVFAGLSYGFQCIVKAGLNMYNNQPDFSLYLALGNWDDELFSVFVEACEIRRGNRKYRK
ncbi:DUF2538 family protein [Cohnella panacarvi]|uniref:DUF2538 family protein n=1 Tax=Cohnella panacarvi TaxID=400776 RepID=UPI00047A9853|nr:DUF2538 family protein [Cohnella panacarvi]